MAESRRPPTLFVYAAAWTGAAAGVGLVAVAIGAGSGAVAFTVAAALACLGCVIGAVVQNRHRED